MKGGSQRINLRKNQEQEGSFQTERAPQSWVQCWTYKLKFISIKYKGSRDTVMLPKASREGKNRTYWKNKESEQHHISTFPLGEEKKTKDQYLQNPEKRISNLEIAT